jgi:hypothetical protein
MMKEFDRTWTFDILRFVRGTLGILGTLAHFRHFTRRFEVELR